MTQSQYYTYASQLEILGAGCTNIVFGSPLNDRSWEDLSETINRNAEAWRKVAAIVAIAKQHKDCLVLIQLTWNGGNPGFYMKKPGDTPTDFDYLSHLPGVTVSQAQPPKDENWDGCGMPAAAVKDFVEHLVLPEHPEYQAPTPAAVWVAPQRIIAGYWVVYVKDALIKR